MLRLLAGRLAALVGILLALTLVVFVIDTVVPTDPVAANLGAGASRALIQATRHRLGYDQPVYVQYFRFLGRILHGDLGTSLRTHNLVTADLAQFAPATIELALFSAALIFVLSLVLGLWSASGRRGAETIRVVMVGFASAPTFFLGIVLVLGFYSWLGILPASGRTTAGSATGFVMITDVFTGRFGGWFDGLRHVLMPSFVIALGPSVAIGRVMRGALLDAMQQDHVRTARSKGLSEWAVLLRHAFRNALTPVLSMAGLQLGLVLTGVIVVETVFAWPGLGLYTSAALVNSDFPAVIGVTMVLGAIYVIINAAVDVLQVIADPRLKDNG
jgi:peptide/nickel transport system permease protein